MPDLMIDDLFKKQPLVGNVLFAMPLNQNTRLNLTSNIGGCSGLYWSLIFQLSKWGYVMKKIEESMDVSPVYAEAYNLTVEQKHKLEAQIKQGLASAAQAVADYELLKHDLRKYKEIMDFLKESKAKDKSDDHILRSMFIDRVDAFVGDQFAMINMVKRWPTIIADFIRLPKYVAEADQSDVDKIRDGLKVTIAEANVLKSKNTLFKKWRESFIPEVSNRYVKILTMVKAREKSMYEYKEWLKPYAARYKTMQESLEKKPKGIFSDAFMAPGLGNAMASSSIRFIAWTPFSSPEMGKPNKLPARFEPERDKFLVKHAKKLIKRYKNNRITYGGGKKVVKLEDEESIKDWIKETYTEAISGDSKRIDKTPNATLSRGTPYYIGFDIECNKSLIKIPKGGEIEDIVIVIREYIMSENLVMLLLLELDILGQQFDSYVNEMIGSKDAEDIVESNVRREFKDLFPEPGDSEGEKPKKERFTEVKEATEQIKGVYTRIGKLLKPYKLYFIRPGPYEPVFRERVPKGFMIPMGGSYFGKLVKFLKWKMGFPGMPEEY